MTIHASPVRLTKGVKTAQRVFKIGEMELPDIGQELEALESARLYAVQFPQVKHATLSAPQIDGDRLIYEVEIAPPKTKG